MKSEILITKIWDCVKDTHNEKDYEDLLTFTYEELSNIYEEILIERC